MMSLMKTYPKSCNSRVTLEGNGVLQGAKDKVDGARTATMSRVVLGESVYPRGNSEDRRIMSELAVLLLVFMEKDACVLELMNSNKQEPSNEHRENQ